MNVGDPVYVSGCSDTSFNSGATEMGPAALAGTSPFGLTVAYSNPGTANATATGCTFNNQQGWPNNLVFSHNSDFQIASSFANDPNSSGLSSPYKLSRNLSFTNSVIVNGGMLNDTYTEGSNTTSRSFDPATLAFNNTV